MKPRFSYPLSFQRCPHCKHRLKPSSVPDPVDGPIPVLACTNPECDYDITYDQLYGPPRAANGGPPRTPKTDNVGKTPGLPLVPPPSRRISPQEPKP